MSASNGITVSEDIRVRIRINGKSFLLPLLKARLLHAKLGRLVRSTPSEHIERVDVIQRVVADEFKLPQSIMRGRGKHDQHAWPRQVAMFLSRELLPDLTLTQLGDEFNRDHGTIIHSGKAVRDRMGTDPKAKAVVDGLRAKLSRE